MPKGTSSSGSTRKKTPKGKSERASSKKRSSSRSDSKRATKRSSSTKKSSKRSGSTKRGKSKDKEKKSRKPRGDGEKKKKRTSNETKRSRSSSGKSKRGARDGLRHKKDSSGDLSDGKDTKKAQSELKIFDKKDVIEQKKKTKIRKEQTKLQRSKKQKLASKIANITSAEQLAEIDKQIADIDAEEAANHYPVMAQQTLKNSTHLELDHFTRFVLPEIWGDAAKIERIRVSGLAQNLFHRCLEPINTLFCLNSVAVMLGQKRQTVKFIDWIMAEKMHAGNPNVAAAIKSAEEVIFKCYIDMQTQQRAKSAQKEIQDDYKLRKEAFEKANVKFTEKDPAVKRQEEIDRAKAVREAEKLAKEKKDKENGKEKKKVGERSLTIKIRRKQLEKVAKDQRLAKYQQEALQRAGRSAPANSSSSSSSEAPSKKAAAPAPSTRLEDDF